MVQQITIQFMPGEEPGQQVVSVEYQPATSEETLLDRAAAIELGMLALAGRATQEREQLRFPVPQVIRDVTEARTFRDFT